MAKRCVYISPQGKACRKSSIYFMMWGSYGNEQSGMVCGEHDRNLGRQNLSRCYQMTKEKAIEFDNRLDRMAKGGDEDLEIGDKSWLKNLDK